MTKEEAIEWIEYHIDIADYDEDDDLPKALKKAVKALQTNPEKDRQESKDYCAECEHAEMCGWYPTDGCDFRRIHPEQKTGRWEVAVGYDPKRRVMCDQCRKMAYEPSNFCPTCGAKMEEVK